MAKHLVVTRLMCKDEKMSAMVEAQAPVFPLDLAGHDALAWPSLRPYYDSAWHGHVSFAHWIVQAVRPRIVVELGTHNGVSFAAFCNAVVRCGLNTKCFAVDSWEGDPHAGHYGAEVFDDLNAFNQRHFSSFSTLLRCYFDDALLQFDDGSIDLLHIDGFHTYEAVKHDIDTWRPKLSDRAVVLFHDTQVHAANFGVWLLWRELSTQYPHFEFKHAAGLGVLALGRSIPASVAALCSETTSESADRLRERFSQASTTAEFSGMADANRLAEERIRLSRPPGTNIAAGCRAFQSSTFIGTTPTPDGALDGVKNGGYGFHTDIESSPWWMVDLGQPSRVDYILIYNRLGSVCKARSRHLVILTSLDVENWDTLYVHNGSIFGGVDGFPLFVEAASVTARFVKIKLSDHQYLHLDEVEIYTGHISVA